MANQKRGQQSFCLPQLPVIQAWASVAGKKESEGPLAHTFDVTTKDTYFGQKTWELAEQKMQQLALEKLAEKAGISKQDFDLVLSGDLLNQCIGSSFSLRNMHIPHLGLYGACSTMAESLLIAAMAVGGGFADKVVAQTSSHFASSERQYRFPLGYGGQRTPTAQWTVTGSGAALVCREGTGPRITACTIGTVTDLGIKDANNMGAAMAPAAMNTLIAHFGDTKTKPKDYDLILTGDLGKLGSEILRDLMERNGYPLGSNYSDCGQMIYNDHQHTYQGGSGAGCSASVFNSYVIEHIKKGTFKKVLFLATGALLSPTTTFQGDTIPAISHAVVVEGGKTQES